MFLAPKAISGGVLIALMLSCAAATAEPLACDARANNTVAKLQQCVTLNGVRLHQAALQPFS